MLEICYGGERGVIDLVVALMNYQRKINPPAPTQSECNEISLILAVSLTVDTRFYFQNLGEEKRS
ncbi:hypothetical protein D3C85_1415890 [compost metagenome]